MPVRNRLQEVGGLRRATATHVFELRFDDSS